MATSDLIALIVLGIILTFFCVAGVRLAFPALRNNEKAQTLNYAGRSVSYGLGIVWIFFLLGELAFIAVGPKFKLIDPYPISLSSLILIMVAMVLGFIDDVYGSGESRGFKGHLKALAQGKLTTGGLKLFTISGACLLVAATSPLTAKLSSNLLGAPSGLSHTLVALGYGVLAGAAIALSTNFINLCDLRPARAQKAFLLLAIVGALIAWIHFGWLNALLVIVVALAPVIAVFGLDAHEVGMLGDTGANPFGILAGCLVVFSFGLNLVGLACYLVIMLALNLASEKVSFSKVISSNKLLTKLDNLGRLEKGNEK